MNALALILLDSAEGSFVCQLAAEGELPAVRRLIEGGTWCPLTTPDDYRSEYPWTEFLTGRTAKSNRYWSTIVFDPVTYGCATVGSARRRPFYVEPDAKVIAFDLPHSVPLAGQPGAQVVGWGGHDSRFQHPRASLPADLLAEIDKRFGRDPSVEVEFGGTWHQPEYLDALADSLIAAAHRRGDIALWLLDRLPDWDLFMMGMTEAHSAGHNMAHGVDPAHLLGRHPTARLARSRFVEVYRAIDDTIGRIVEALPEGTTVGLISSKGMEPDRDDVAAGILLPELLHRLATGHTRLHEPTHRAWARQGFPAIAPEPDRRATDRLDWLLADNRADRLKRWLRAFAPAGVVRTVRIARRWASSRRSSAIHLGDPVASPGVSQDPTSRSPMVLSPDGTEPTLAGEVEWQQAMLYRDQWPTMPWFALPSFGLGHIRLNLIGRESHGVVAREDYERTCDELEAQLRAATDPRTGKPVVAEVRRIRSDDPMATDGPDADLIVSWLAPVDTLEHPKAGIVGPFAFPRSGSHTSNGFLLLEGPGFTRATLRPRAVLDLAPTIRALLGWSALDQLEGTVIAEVLNPPAV